MGQKIKISMKRILSISLVLLAFSGCLKAQQDYQVTHFMFDKLSVNPAYAGINDKLCASLIGRNQWSGLENGGAPVTRVLNVHSPIEKFKGGLGLTMFSDKLGDMSNTFARVAYSYHLNVLGGKLGVGASVGLASIGFDKEWLTPSGESAELDKFIPSVGSSDSALDFDFGVYYRNNSFYAGISTTHLTAPSLSEVHVDLSRHYFLMAGYEYQGLMNGDLSLKPSVFVKSDAVTTQVDVNLLAEYKSMIWGGVSYRLKDAIAPMVGYAYHFNNKSDAVLKIGYSYGVTTSEIKNYSNNTHEIALNYCMKISKPEVLIKSKNPRFL